MKKTLNVVLLLTSLLGYMQWGKGNHAFVGQVEFDLLFRKAPAGENFLHPFILVPICGQLLLLVTLFQKVPGRRLTLAGLSCLSIIMLFLLFIGIMGGNLRIILAALPFVITGITVLLMNRRKKGAEPVAETY